MMGLEQTGASSNAGKRQEQHALSRLPQLDELPMRGEHRQNQIHLSPGSPPLKLVAKLFRLDEAISIYRRGHKAVRFPLRRFCRGRFCRLRGSILCFHSPT